MCEITNNALLIMQALNGLAARKADADGSTMLTRLVYDIAHNADTTGLHALAGGSTKSGYGTFVPPYAQGCDLS